MKIIKLRTKMFYNIGPLRKRLSTVDLLIEIAWFIDKEKYRFSNVSREIG
jgi:hypothetical protein